jgi:Cu/Ag efflux pump CusA
MLAWLISSSVRLRTLVVVVAAGLLILGAVDVRNKPLDVIPELALPSLTVKTAGGGPAQRCAVAAGHPVGIDGGTFDD